ncbi:hypothetical protein E2C01_070878 [Portunus trituberculatus]|uniref:Uncharacterized protein n=1 Tax=Portunus trituberculatus TaxID=210409 RepID=A0A5B7I2T6_PORTR|nr:hypothetical protein [Portunus trituberculatus]
MNDSEYWLTLALEIWTKYGQEEEKNIVQRGRRKGDTQLARSKEQFAIKDSKRCNIPEMRKRLKTVGQKREVDDTKSFSFHSF